jgi:hypothetical protein
MCHDRRETVTVTDMGGDSPKRLWGFTVSDAVMKRVVSYGGVAAATLSLVALFSMVYGFVQSTGEAKVRRVMAEELKPGGLIYEAQQAAIEQHRKDAESAWMETEVARFNYLRRRLDQLQANQDRMMQEIGVEPLRFESQDLPANLRQPE